MKYSQGILSAIDSVSYVFLPLNAPCPRSKYAQTGTHLDAKFLKKSIQRRAIPPLTQILAPRKISILLFTLPRILRLVLPFPTHSLSIPVPQFPKHLHSSPTLYVLPHLTMPTIL